MPGIDTFWVGGAPAVAQISNVTVGGTLAGETFQILIGGEVVAEHTDATTVIADTVAALVAAFNVSDSPYCDGLIAASNASPVVVLTSDVGGLPFEVTINAPGGSATFALTTPTVSAGPHHWDSAANWSGAAVPDDTDYITVDMPTARILWGLDQHTVLAAYLNLANFAMIGLRRDVFVTSADGSTWSTARPEYRDQWLDIGWSLAHVGEQSGTGSASIGRLKLRQNLAGGQRLDIWDTGNASIDPNLPAIRYTTSGLSAGNATHVTVRDAPGGVGFGVDDPAAECHMGNVRIMGSASKIYAYSMSIDGSILTWDEWLQEDGMSRIVAGVNGSDYNPVIVNGGTMHLTLWDTLAQLDVNDGATVYDYSIIAIDDEITLVNLRKGGRLDMTKSKGAKTYTTVNQSQGSALVRNDLLTITTWNLPADQDYTLALT